MRILKMFRQLTIVQFKTMMRNRWALMFNMIVPLAFLVLFGSLFGNDDVAPHLKVGLLDNDHGVISQELQKSLTNGGMDIVSGSADDLMAQMRKAGIRAVISLPAHASEQVSAQQAPVAMIVTYDPGSQTSRMALGQIQSALGHLNGTVQQTRPVVVMQPEQLPETAKMTIMDYMMPGELAFMLLNANIVSLIISLVNARQNGTMRHQLSTPLPVGVLLGSQVLGNLVVALVQCALVIATGVLFFHANVPSNLGGTLVVLIVSVLATAGIGLAIGSLFKNVETAQPIGVIISMGMAFLGNAMMPLDNAPPLMQTISKLLPSNYIVDALRNVMMRGESISTVTLDLAILGTWAVVLLCFGTWQLRRQTVAS